MERSYLNTCYWGLILGSIPAFSMFLMQYSYWWLGYVIVLFLVKSQPYIYLKKESYYLRTKPFIKGQPINEINSKSNIEVFEIEKNITKIWDFIIAQRSNNSL